MTPLLPLSGFRDIIRSLLAFATEQFPEKREQSLSDVVRHAIERIGDRTPDATIELQLDEQLPLARIDAIAFERVLVNLIDNATQAAKLPVRVTIRTRKSDERIRLVVEDDGPGIPDDIKDCIFEPFFLRRSTSAAAWDLA
jgi:two-component system sensor histidine kinase KdpD